MNNNQQAKNGFKTFIVTLSVSLLLFGTLYYLTSDSTNEVDIEESMLGTTETVAYEPQEADVKGATDQPSVFGELKEKPVDAQPAVVLAGAEESTESTVPDTGSEQVLGIALAMSFFSIAVYILLIGPRKFALSGFERDLTEQE